MLQIIGLATVSPKENIAGYVIIFHDMEFSDLIQSLSTLVNAFNIVSFIASIASIALACVSIFLAIKFYAWGEKSNKAISEMSVEIKSNTEKLSILFDKMFDTSFRMIESQSTAMQNKLFNSSGTLDSQNIINYEFEILTHIIAQKSCSYEDLYHQFPSMNQSRIKKTVELILSTNKQVIEHGGIIQFIQQDSSSSSDLIDSDSQKVESSND